MSCAYLIEAAWFFPKWNCFFIRSRSAQNSLFFFDKIATCSLNGIGAEQTTCFFLHWLREQTISTGVISSFALLSSNFPHPLQ